MREGAPGTRPSLAFGCSVLAAILVALGVAAVAFVVFLESGASTGRVTLDPLDAYPPGTVSRFPRDGFYLVRMPDGSTLALSDLDAANRAATGRRCRVAPIPAGEPALEEALERYRARLSPGTGSLTLIFRETCFGSLYDAAGIRLDADGPNLDRLGLDLDDQGNLVVETAERSCTRRDGRQLLVAVDCP